MKNLRQYISQILLENAGNDLKLIEAFVDSPSHGLHLAQMLEHELAEGFYEIRENIILLIELVEDKSDLLPWGGYNYSAQNGINRVGEHIVDDLVSIGIKRDHPVMNMVTAVYMGCTNSAKGPYCIEKTEDLKTWVES